MRTDLTTLRAYLLHHARGLEILSFLGEGDPIPRRIQADPHLERALAEAQEAHDRLLAMTPEATRAWAMGWCARQSHENGTRAAEAKARGKVLTSIEEAYGRSGFGWPHRSPPCLLPLAHRVQSALAEERRVREEASFRARPVTVDPDAWMADRIAEKSQELEQAAAAWAKEVARVAEVNTFLHAFWTHLPPEDVPPEDVQP